MAPSRYKKENIDISFLDEAMGYSKDIVKPGEDLAEQEPVKITPVKKETKIKTEKKEPKERIYVSIPGDLKKEARLEALKENITFNDLVIKAIKEYLEKE